MWETQDKLELTTRFWKKYIFRVATNKGTIYELNYMKISLNTDLFKFSTVDLNFSE